MFKLPLLLKKEATLQTISFKNKSLLDDQRS